MMKNLDTSQFTIQANTYAMLLPEKVNQLKFACKELLICDLCKTLSKLKYDLI